MKVAFTTQDLETVDAHFGWTPHLAIYDVRPSGHRHLVTVDLPQAAEDGGEEKLAARLEALEGCAVLVTSAIGTGAVARVSARGVHPIKVPDREPILRSLDRLCAVLAGTPPPWLRRLLLREEVSALDLSRRAGGEEGTP
ncbi:nitrogen fixation protein NifX [Anaeromyxobacter paludicola]|uniref:Nitrogen fixation protein NifX n=1 Tax=Anaeromyxobacter paludicola TaxID=2918171 RepID=A0ABN6NEB5_9BACT|nr:nitrogen fixation protein NifX [Anaeromyxobacter paludicola]BDG10846.1 nitrogen fixation protein NifX [Anaeromyxobacter paludicola]